MKKRYLKWISLCAAICIAAVALMGAGSNRQEETIKELLEKRNNVMENVLFGKITYDEGKTKLKEIEEGDLYDKDLQSLVEYRNTEVEPIEDMEIVRIEKESDIYDIMAFRGEIKWTYQGVDGIYQESEIYRIGVSEKNDICRLISLEIQEN